MTFFVNMPEEEEEIEEEEASLDDDLLAELDPIEDEDEADPLTEGFGELPEEEEKAIEKASEEESEEEEEESLEEDAEDVDFDTFDDVDEF